MFNFLRKKEKLIDNRINEVICSMKEECARQEEKEAIRSREQRDLIEKIRRQQQKQGNMLEEILELLDEQQEEREELQEVSQKQEEALLNIIMTYTEYQKKIYAYFEEHKDENSEVQAWMQQMEILRITLDRSMSLGQVERIAQEGVPVDPVLHEVIRVENLSIEKGMEKDLYENGMAASLNGMHMVKKVVLPGLVYKGAVWQRAKIIAYRVGQ